MTDIFAVARQALKLHRQGKTNPEVKQALGLGYSTDAIRMIEVGRRQERIEDSRLTDRELAVLRALARAERQRQAQGDTGHFNGKWLGGFGWRPGTMLRVIRKRMGHARGGEALRINAPSTIMWGGTGLGLIDHWHGGGVKLTRAGWALVHAIEDVETATVRSMIAAQEARHG